jgi:hypothetical protein
VRKDPSLSPFLCQVWYKQYNATHWDYATFAAPSSLAWAQSNGYTFSFVTGYVFPATSAPSSSGSPSVLTHPGAVLQG